MAKGVSIKFKSYQETIPALLRIIKFDIELKKHKSIILKPWLDENELITTPAVFVEEILKFCLQHKEKDSQIFIAEGADGEDTKNLYDKHGYSKIAEKFSIGLIDLNTVEIKEIVNDSFIKFSNIYYPKILLESFVISLPKLLEDEEIEMRGAMSNMLGAFPASYYQGFFSNVKNKIRKWPAKYSIHDIVRCKMPEFSVMDASEKGFILAGRPLEIDIQASKLLGKEWKSIGHLKLINDRIAVQESNKNPQQAEQLA